MTYVPEIETKSPHEIFRYQSERLIELMAYLHSHSFFYQNMFQLHGIDYRKIKTLNHLVDIPVTTKDDLQQHNDDFLCVNRRSIVDYVTTSGTMGEPVTFAMTNNDLDRLAYNEYMSFSCANTTEDDVFQLMVTLDKRFMAGMAYFLGLRRLGAGIVRSGPGLQKLQFESMKKFNPSGLITVPSFIPKLIDYANDQGINFRDLGVKKAVCIGEPIRNNDFTLNTLGRKITEQWELKLYSTYASTEMGTAFTECEAGQGGHHHPEMIIVEFLDEDNQPVGPGQLGEVTITTLGVEAMPLLRFKTGDLCYHFTERCSCGRTTMRLGPVMGRKQHMIKLKGTTLYPPAIYDVLNEMAHIQNYIVEVFTNALGTDEILVKAGCSKASAEMEKIMKDHFRARLRVAPEIKFYSIAEIAAMQMPEHTRKPIVFIDNRKS